MDEIQFSIPSKPGFIFSHWSEIPPESNKEQVPFDFQNRVILENTTLYAVFIPSVKVTFKSDNVTCGVQDLMKGSKAYNPLSK